MLGKLTTTLLLLAAAAAPTHTLANSHVHIRIHTETAAANISAVSNSSASTRDSAEVPTGPVNVDELDPSLYKIAACAPQSWEIRRENATFVWLDFASLNASGDQIIVSTLNGTKPQVYNSAPSGLSTKPIPGSAVKLEFRPSETSGGGCASSGKLPSFSLVGVGYGLPKQVRKESTCGKSELRNVACLSSALAGKERAVVRMLTVGQDTYSFCTAWLWGSDGEMITNNHCVSSQSAIDNVQFQFQVQTASCAGTCTDVKCPLGEEFFGKGNVKFIQTNKELDYTLMRITVNAEAIVKKYGYLKIRDGAPQATERIMLIQHPNGGPKVVPANVTVSGGSKLHPGRLTTSIEFPTIQSIIYDGSGSPFKLKYMADTDKGSSGSPIISERSKSVVGLHRGGGCPNEGIASSALAASLRKFANSGNNGFASN